jgi:hypothetical protein
MKSQDHVPSSTFHGPYKQQKYGHRQSRRSWLISLHVHQLEVAISCILYLMNERPSANKTWTAVIAVEILVR